MDWVRAIGAGMSLWHFLGSQAAAVCIWGPLLTLAILLASRITPVPLPYLIIACIFAFGGVVWCFSLSVRTLDRFRERYQKIAIAFDRTVPSCRADVTFVGGSHSMCFRLKVNNKSQRKLHECEGWLESTDRFPNVSPAQLFWVGNPEAEMSINLLKDIPRFLQICRIDDKNCIHIATQREQWPIDSHNFPLGDYVFKIGIKGEDDAETCFYSVKLTWTGNWTTAEMMPVAND